MIKNPKVLFAGYKVPHPLEHSFLLKIQTTPDTNPMDVLQSEINNLINEISTIAYKFEVLILVVFYASLIDIFYTM